jgi:peptidoglycan/xylan/chitin deacetylase (PgdA/CDA1 family)
MLKAAVKFALTSAVVLGLAIPQSQLPQSTEASVRTPILSYVPAQVSMERLQEDLDPVEPIEEPEEIAEPEAVDCEVVKCIALTFDDGPHPNTLKILASLKKRGAKATFFVVGAMVRTHPEIAQLIVEQGHEIAAHSNTHQRLTRLSRAQLQRDFARTNKAISQATGVKPEIFRPPYGIHSAQVRAQAKLPVVLWNVDPQDWLTRSSKQTVARVLANASPGSIVVMHDPLGSTANAIPLILRELSAQGYHFVTVSELMGPMEPGKLYLGVENEQ